MAAKNIEPIYGLNMKKASAETPAVKIIKNINCNLAVLIIALMLYLYPIISNIFSDIFPFVILVLWPHLPAFRKRPVCRLFLRLPARGQRYNRRI